MFVLLFVYFPGFPILFGFLLYSVCPSDNYLLSLSWNALPSDIRAVTDMKAFRQAVKTHYLVWHLIILMVLLFYLHFI